MGEKEGVKKKLEIKVTVVWKNGIGRECAEGGGEKIEENVMSVGENDRQAMLEEAVTEFIKRVEREKIRRLKKQV